MTNNPKKLKIGIRQCTECNSTNYIWLERMKLVESDIVYCWHCGTAHKFTKEEKKVE